MSDVDYAAAAVTALERLNAVYNGGSTDGWEEKETNDSGMRFLHCFAAFIGGDMHFSRGSWPAAVRGLVMR